MTHYEIVKKLIGKTEPVGETRQDEERLDNLIQTMSLVEQLLNDIKVASSYSTNHEKSMNFIGTKAKNFLDNLKEELNDNTI